jgi:HlyD family secretion protein
LAYENTIIRAPFDGQIGSVSAIVGQQTSTQAGVATIITKNKLAQISLNEVDVTNVKLGQDVDLTFDAIPGEFFKGKIYQMDAVGVAVSNVVSFGVKISVDSDDTRIKSGMSVTANIIVEEKKDVLTVPSGTIKSEKSGGENKFYVMKALAPLSLGERPGERVKKVSSDSGVKVIVQTGMTNDVDTEILEGENNTLNEGDEIISKTINSNMSAKPQATFSLFGNRAPGTGNTGGGNRTGGTGR